MTRKAIDLIRRSYGNNAEFVTSLFNDPFLKQKLKIIVYDLDDLHMEYALCHEEHSKGQAHMMKWAAERAFGRMYMDTVCKIIQRMTHPELVDVLLLTPPGPRPLSSCSN